jgi:hypothetical protein
MNIIEDSRSVDGWITCIIKDRWVQAKVYNNPSHFGINEGRVSKLVIAKTEKPNLSNNLMDELYYNYDRGLDFDEAPPGLVNEVVNELEKLPKINI